MTVSIRASLMLSALAMAGLTAAFVDPPEAEENAKSGAVAPGHWSYGGEGGPHMADVVAHTGLGPEEVAEIHAAGLDYLSKPVKPAALRALLSRHLSLR